MKASGEVVRRTFSLRNCDLYDVVGYRWSGTFFRSEEFLSQFSDPNHIIGDWSGVCEVGREIDSCLRVKTFPNFQFEGVWSMKVNCVQLTVHFVCRLVSCLRFRWFVDDGEL